MLERYSPTGNTWCLAGPGKRTACLESGSVKKCRRCWWWTLTAFQTGFAAAPRDRSAEFFLTFNRTDDQNRVQNIFTALAYLKQEGAKDLRVVGIGKAAVWALLAAAASPVPVTFEGKIEGFSGEDRDYIERFFVPGIQRAGGLESARRLLNIQ